MKFSGKVTGTADLMKAFQRLEHAVSKQVMTEALLDAAEPMRSEAAAQAPRSDTPPHLADNIVVAPTRFGTNGKEVGPDVAAVAIGPSLQPGNFFYGMFQEFGTSRHAAQPFMRPAFDSQRRAVRKRLAASVAAAMKRRSKG